MESTSSTTVYLYMSHTMGTIANTLFAIPLNPSNFNYKQQQKKKKNGIETDNDYDYDSVTSLQKIEPIIEFPRSEFPRQMACEKLGSKFYFLGGERFPPDHPDDPATRIYPPHVYVFDEDLYQSQGKAVVRKLEVGMASGKPSPMTFTADGKLFILGSCGGPYLISHMSIFPTRLPSSSFRFFEVYDPATNQWTLLDDPPVTTPTLWVSTPVIIGRLVYLYGQLLGHRRSGVLVCFDLDSYKWVQTSKDAYLQLCRHRPGRILIGDTYYGLDARGAGVVRQSLLAQQKDDHDHDRDRDQLLFSFPMDRNRLSSNDFCHLWDRHFCAVVTGSFPDPHLPLHFGMLDQRRRYFSILVFRELPAQEGTQSIPSSQLLYSADYLFQSSYSSFGSLFGCYPCHTTQLPMRPTSSLDLIQNNNVSLMKNQRPTISASKKKTNNISGNYSHLKK